MSNLNTRCWFELECTASHAAQSSHITFADEAEKKYGFVSFKDRSLAERALEVAVTRPSHF